VKDARQRKRAWYGGAIIILLVAIAFLIFFAEAIRQRLERRYAVVIVMPRAPPGLGDGSPVWIGGKEVGTVTAVGFLPSGPDTLANVVVTVDLPVAARTHVRTDTRVRLTSARIIGEPALDLLPGSATARVLEDGDTLRIERRPTVAELSRDAAAVRAQLDTSRVALQRLVPRLRARAGQTRRALAGLEAAMAEARSLERSVGASPTLALLGDPAFATSLARTQSYSAELGRLLALWRGRTTSGSELRAAVERLQLNADSLRAQLDATLVTLQTGNGTLARAQSDSALVHAIGAARAALDSLVAETKRNPLRYIF
jgi:hypothetical protein